MLCLLYITTWMTHLGDVYLDHNMTQFKTKEQAVLQLALCKGLRMSTTDKS